MEDWARRDSGSGVSVGRRPYRIYHIQYIHEIYNLSMSALLCFIFHIVNIYCNYYVFLASIETVVRRGTWIYARSLASLPATSPSLSSRRPRHSRARARPLVPMEAGAWWCSKPCRGIARGGVVTPQRLGRAVSCEDLAFRPPPPQRMYLYQERHH